MFPKVIAFDPEGKWVISEFVEGPTLGNYLKIHPEPSMQVIRSLKDLYLKVKTIREDAQIHLDLAPDNIIIKDDQAYLVDLGEARLISLPETFELFLKRMARGQKLRCSDLLNLVTTSNIKGTEGF